ncbi:MAG: hypothetical protein WBM02_05645 [bacterium]
MNSSEPWSIPPDSLSSFDESPAMRISHTRYTVLCFSLSVLRMQALSAELALRAVPRSWFPVPGLVFVYI